MDMLLADEGDRPWGLDVSDDLDEQLLPGVSDADIIESPLELTNKE